MIYLFFFCYRFTHRVRVHVYSNILYDSTIGFFFFFMCISLIPLPQCSYLSHVAIRQKAFRADRADDKDFEPALSGHKVYARSYPVYERHTEFTIKYFRRFFSQTVYIFMCLFFGIYLSTVKICNEIFEVEFILAA